MIRPRRLLPALFLIAGLALAADPLPGDTRQETENKLGKPVAVKKSATGELVAKYRRGTVTYRQDRVFKVTMLSPDELARRQAEEQADAVAAEARAKAAAEAKAARTAADNTARDAYITSEAYKQLSTAGRLAALTALAEKHPDAELAVLRNDLELMVTREETARREQNADAAARKQLEEKITALEERVNELTTKLAESTAANTRLFARLENAEIVSAALAQRLKALEESAAKPAAPTGPVVTRTPRAARP